MRKLHRGECLSPTPTPAGHSLTAYRCSPSEAELARLPRSLITAIWDAFESCLLAPGCQPASRNEGEEG